MSSAPVFPFNVIANLVRVLMTPADEIPVLEQRFYRDESGQPKAVLAALADLRESRDPAPAVLAQALPGAIGDQVWRPVALTVLSKLGLREEQVLQRAVAAELEELQARLARGPQ